MSGLRRLTSSGFCVAMPQLHLPVWQERQTTGVRIPAQVRELLEATYADREDNPESWQTLADEAFARAMACRQKALSASNIWQPALDC